MRKYIRLGAPPVNAIQWNGRNEWLINNILRKRVKEYTTISTLEEEKWHLVLYKNFEESCGSLNKGDYVCITKDDKGKLYAYIEKCDTFCKKYFPEEGAKKDIVGELVGEQEELAFRIGKLASELADYKVTATLSPEEEELMYDQLTFMKNYNDTLKLRLDHYIAT